MLPCLSPLVTHHAVYLSTLLPVLPPQNDSPGGKGSSLFPAQCWAHKREFGKLQLTMLMSEHTEELTRFTLEASAARVAAAASKIRIQRPVKADMHSDGSLRKGHFLSISMRTSLARRLKKVRERNQSQ